MRRRRLVASIAALAVLLTLGGRGCAECNENTTAAARSSDRRAATR